VWSEVEFERSFAELVEGGCELEAVVEEAGAGEDVESEAGTRHGHHQTTHVPETHTQTSVTRSTQALYFSKNIKGCQIKAGLLYC
jgi:hypothetical protein